MKNDSLSNVLGLYLLGALVVAGAVGYFVIKPLINQGQKTGVEISETKVKYEGLQQLEKDTAKLKRTYAAVKDKRDQVLNQLPVKNEEERLLALLSSFGQASGVVVSAFTPEGVQATPEGEPVSSISLYPAQVSVSGKYDAVKNFMIKVEQSARFIDVQKMSLAGTSSSRATSLDANLTLQAYYQQDVLDETLAVTGGQSE